MKAVHRHSLGHEHEFEPQHGLPEVLPEDERVLWQGAPDWRSMAIEVFHVRQLAIYFGLMLVLRAGFVLADGGGVMAVLTGWAWLAPLAVAAVGIMVLLARLCARTTAYTITSKRVVLRIGIVLTVTFNIPFKRIDAAGLLLRGDNGCGDVPITLAGRERIPILQLWPHARPWHVALPQPSLRCVPNAAEVGRLLSQAWSASRGEEARPSPPAPAAQAANDAPLSAGAGLHHGSPQLVSTRAA